MKNAKLWKRILHEGLAAYGEHLAVEIIQNAIAAAPIICCPTYSIELGKARNFKDYSKLAVPFEKFWIERVVADTERSMLEGMFVASVKEKDWYALTVAEVLAADMHKPSLAVSWQFRIDAAGGLVMHGPDQVAIQMLFARDDMADDQTTNEIRTATLDLCDMLSLLSCKNIDLASRDLGLSNREKRHAEKRGASAGFRYHVLTVRPAGSKPGTPGEEIGNMPRHVCRGHFAEYGPEFNRGLLFGKYAGRFYIPPHMKGDAKNGVVKKDYEVAHA